MEQPVDDILILEQLRKGNERAFQHLFETYFVSLCRFVRIYVSQENIAEEIVLDLFTSVWEKRQTLSIQLMFKAYLFQSVRNRALNYIRDNERFVPLDDFVAFEYSENDYAFDVRELERLIEEAVCSLSDKNREVFRMSREYHLTNKEIASQLNISVKAVESHITKALKYIKKYLGDSYHYLW